MAVYLQIEELTKSVGDRMLFENVTFGVNEGDKIGIVAKNGTGKTTLLNIIAGIDTPDSGTVTYRGDLKVCYLTQLPELTPGASIIEACLEDGGSVAETVTRYEHAMALGNPDEITAAAHEMDSAGAWDYEDRVKQMLTQLGFADVNASVDNLSGGQKKRVAVARALMQYPDMIILDEPTNHLDVEVIEWIENYLKRQRVTLLMVTHDRYFLDRICNRIIELDDRTAYFYDGNYDYYLRRRAERIEAMNTELARVKNTLRKEQEWMSRQPQARAGKAKYRIDQFYDLKERSKNRHREDNVRLETKASYIGSKIFEAEGISKRFGDKIILDDFTYTFGRYEKLGIVGVNGVGKSTFIKLLQGLIEPDSGSWNVGETVRFGYYSQEGIDFDENKKVIDAVTEIAEDIEQNGVHVAPMQFLQKFLFSVPDQQKYIHTLSGGERCRLQLATVFIRQPNFLILDEPTNDLDIVTLGILEEYLSQFKGCVIVISHDRYFLDNVVDHLFVMEGNGVIKDFPGTYSEYAQWRQEQAKATETTVKNENSAKSSRHQGERREKMTFKERKEFEALEQEMELLNAEKAELDRLFNSGETINDVAEKSARYTEIVNLLDEKEMRWLELSEKA
ncbi:MAG: ABC-F family ATP-binding cassette domain-containing protein [Muribaculaceae bacterium]|nr:ABC-F family ATP-binding cassette domain-containing protein [Muribaculaceae bacterium]